MQTKQEFLSFVGGFTEEQWKNLDEKDRQLLFYQAMALEKERENNPLAFFIPNGAQEQLIRSVGNQYVTKKRVILDFAANGVGKSSGIVCILGNIFWRMQSEWFQYPLYQREWIYPKTIWYLSNHEAFETKHTKEFQKWFPRGRYKASKNGKKFDSLYKTDTGFEMYCMTYDQDPLAFESADVGLVVYDEPPPQDIRSACVSRLRQGGFEAFVCTPLSHSAWIFDEIVDKPEQEPNIEVLYADIESNCLSHGVRGKLDHEQIVYIVSQYDQDEREARAFGRPKHLAGKKYKILHPDVHTLVGCDPKNFPQTDYQIYCVLDPHDRKPPAIAWFAVEANGKKYVVDEYPNDPRMMYHQIKSTELTYIDYAKIIKQKEMANGWTDSKKIIRVIDPNKGVTKQGTSGKSVRMQLMEQGKKLNWKLAFIARVSDDLTSGHAAVDSLLKKDVDGIPNLKIGDNCTNTMYQMTRYGFKEHTAKKQMTDGLSERMAQKYKDFADLVRYFAMMVRDPKRGEKHLQALKEQQKAAKGLSSEHDNYRRPKAQESADWRTNW